MKATLEFNLPEEQSDLDYAINGVKWAVLVENILGKLRNAYKHNPQNLPRTVIKYAENLADEIRSAMIDEGLKLE